jgi:hypothetical protein
LAKRKTNSPWGSAYKEGLPSTAVNDRVEVDEILYPSVNTGNIDVATGQWEGVTLSDQHFTIDATHESVGNGASVLCPQATPDYIDMTNFSDLFIAIRPTNGGNVAIEAVYGPATNAFANLAPIRAGSSVRIATDGEPSDEGVYSGFQDATEALATDVWNIYNIQGRLSDQKVLQFNITNNSGGASDITFAYLRVA